MKRVSFGITTKGSSINSLVIEDDSMSEQVYRSAMSLNLEIDIDKTRLTLSDIDSL